MLRSDDSHLTLVPAIVTGYPLVQEKGGLARQTKIKFANEMEGAGRQIEDDRHSELGDATCRGPAPPETPVVPCPWPAPRLTSLRQD